MHNVSFLPVDLEVFSITAHISDHQGSGRSIPEQPTFCPV